MIINIRYFIFFNGFKYILPAEFVIVMIVLFGEALMLQMGRSA